MHRIGLLLFVGFVVIACSKEEVAVESAQPGFGIGEVEINSGAAKIPVFLRYDKPVKGVEFVLSWNLSELEVKSPILLPGNESFSVHSKVRDGNQLKVLVFSMKGDAMDLSNEIILHLPVVSMDGFKGISQLSFSDYVFAGGNSASYDIPVENGIISVN